MVRNCGIAAVMAYATQQIAIFSTQNRAFVSGLNRKQLLIPPKFGNGHLVLTEVAIFHYKQTTEYDREGQFTIIWNDPEYNLWWPIKHPILSTRDAGGDR